jgi:hypothetical protein
MDKSASVRIRLTLAYLGVGFGAETDGFLTSGLGAPGLGATAGAGLGATAGAGFGAVAGAGLGATAGAGLGATAGAVDFGDVG